VQDVAYVSSRFSKLLQLAECDSRKFWQSFKVVDRTLLPFDAPQAQSYFESLLSGQSEPPPVDLKSATCESVLGVHEDEVFPMEPAVRRRLHEQVILNLNSLFTVGEIEQAQARLKNYKAADFQGLIIEMFKYAYKTVKVLNKETRKYVFSSVITTLFNRMFMAGVVPHQLNIGTIIPIFKSGDRTDLNNYRGITVISLLSKWYASAINIRLDRFAEVHHLRSIFQAGFRRKFTVSDWLFTLNSLIVGAEHYKEPLYICFVDLKKAFDSLRRDVMIAVLKALGFHGYILDAIIAIYSAVRCGVRINKKLSDLFYSTMGVRQGDPLSSLLFGLVIDRFEKFEETRAPGMGKRMGTLLLQMLLFADDILLVANSRDTLQMFVNLLGEFCDMYHLTVNTSKTVAMLFTNTRGKFDVSPLLCKGQPILFTESSKYLGLTFHAKKGVIASIPQLCAAATRAICSVHRKSSYARVNNAAIKLKLFDSMVVPILTYGCVVWAPQFSSNPFYAPDCVRNDVEKVHVTFLRRLVGARKSIPYWVLLREFGRTPICLAWWVAVAKFSKRLFELPDSSVLKQVMRYEIQLSLQGSTKNWLSRVLSSIAVMGIDGFRFDQTNSYNGIMRAIHSITPKLISSTLLDSWCKWWVASPSLPDTPFMIKRYATYFATTAVSKDGWFICPPHSHKLFSSSKFISLVQFRLCSHHLQCVVGKWGTKNSVLAVEKQKCPLCDSGVCEDEEHFIFHCDKLSVARSDSKFASLFSSACLSLRTLFGHDDHSLVADLLVALFDARAKTLIEIQSGRSN
jgi:Reverse transcriptase (RNA-dependent DNA polymerase)